MAMRCRLADTHYVCFLLVGILKERYSSVGIEQITKNVEGEHPPHQPFIKYREEDRY